MTRLPLVIVVMLTIPLPAFADPALDALVAAYPDQLAGHDGTVLIWKDGTRMPVSDGKPDKNFEEMMERPSIIDQFSIPYRLGAPATRPEINEDPGRIRHEAFFLKMYGDCRTGDVAKQLRPVAWLPRRGGRTVMVTTINGIADKLEIVSRELDRLPAELTKYMVPSAGTYKCRTIAGTSLISMHSYGIAIDLNANFGDYWLWQKTKTGSFVWKNRIPPEIVDVFERHGFIWGGKWFHFDSFHFEYRPEIIALAKKGWPRR